jgi:hypothetical protein
MIIDLKRQYDYEDLNMTGHIVPPVEVAPPPQCHLWRQSTFNMISWKTQLPWWRESDFYECHQYASREETGVIVGKAQSQIFKDAVVTCHPVCQRLLKTLILCFSFCKYILPPQGAFQG